MKKQFGTNYKSYQFIFFHRRKVVFLRFFSSVRDGVLYKMRYFCILFIIVSYFYNIGVPLLGAIIINNNYRTI